MGLAALLTVLFFMPTATPQAATKNTTTWKVEVNEKYSGTLTLDGTQWYLNCSKVNFKRLNYFVDELCICRLRRDVKSPLDTITLIPREGLTEEEPFMTWIPELAAHVSRELTVSGK